MAVAAGACVASMCYNQPLLGDFAVYFNASADEVGWVAIAAQSGYALGLLCFVPLGDIRERRRLLCTLILTCAALMAATALAPSLPWLIVGSFLGSATAIGAQILMPFAVQLSRPGAQGHTVGVMITGLVCGLMLGRALGGIVGDLFGWRAVYGGAALVLVTIAALLHHGLPRHPATLALSYGQVMRSLEQVLRGQPRMWRPTLVGACSFATFTLFWATLSFQMADRFQRGASEAGLFALIGISGAIAAPRAGRFADRRGAHWAVMLALGLGLVAFATMGGWLAMAGLLLGAVLMDIGVQSLQAAEQGGVLSLVPEARSRLNTIFMVARFAGGALGSLIGVTAWTHGGWTWVCVAGFGLTLLALTIHLVGRRLEAPRR